MLPGSRSEKKWARSAQFLRVIEKLKNTIYAGIQEKSNYLITTIPLNPLNELNTRGICVHFLKMVEGHYMQKCLLFEVESVRVCRKLSLSGSVAKKDVFVILRVKKWSIARHVRHF